MRLEFVSRIVMAWEDPRVTLLEKTEMRLDVLLLEFMWTPKITVENRKTKDGSFFDFGKVGEANRGKPMSRIFKDNFLFLFKVSILPILAILLLQLFNQRFAL